MEPEPASCGTLSLREMIPVPINGVDLVSATVDVPLGDFEYAYGLKGSELGLPEHLRDEVRSCVVLSEGVALYVSDSVESLADRTRFPLLCGEVYSTRLPYYTSCGVVVRRSHASIRREVGEEGRPVTTVTMTHFSEPGDFGQNQVVFLTRGEVIDIQV